MTRLHMNAGLADPTVGKSGIVQQGQSRSDGGESGEDILAVHEPLSLPGNLPRQRESLAGERHLPQEREAVMSHSTDPQGLSSHAIALDEVGWQGEQCRDGGRRHAGIVPAGGGRVL